MKGGFKINQIILIGRLTKDPEISKLEGKNYSTITLAVKRQFKNSDGIYETDFITCSIWNIVAERLCEYCKKGDLISVRGRIQNNNYTSKEGEKVYKYEIIGEQVSFMQSHTKPNDNELLEA